MISFLFNRYIVLIIAFDTCDDRHNYNINCLPKLQNLEAFSIFCNSLLLTIQLKHWNTLHGKCGLPLWISYVNVFIHSKLVHSKVPAFNINMKLSTLTLFLIYTLHCMFNNQNCVGQYYYGEKYYWRNSLKSRYLLNKFFPLLPEFYPATRSYQVSFSCLLYHGLNVL